MVEKACCTTEAAAAPNGAEAPATRDETRRLSPAVDIYDSEGGLTVVADMPGVDPQGLQIHIENGVLTLAGRIAVPAGGTADYREFELADYFRQFQLSESADQEKIAAELTRGVLKLTIPRREAVKPRQIEVKVA